MLLTPLSHRAWFVAYVGPRWCDGLAVGLGVFVVTSLFAWPGLAQWWWIVVFAVLGGVLLGALGLIAGLWAEKFDQMAMFQNFVIVPMTFCRVCFTLCTRCPIFGMPCLASTRFYLIDGFRCGFFGVSDVSPWESLVVVSLAVIGVSALALHLLKTGYKIRH